MIVGYLRVSTKKQDLESQKVGIDDYCKKNNIIINRWVEEKVSGAKEIKSRQIGKVIPSLKANDTLIVSEISRLGRSAMNVLTTIEALIKRKVNLIFIKQNLRLETEGGAIQSMMAKMFIHFSALFAECERDMMKQRVKEGIRRRKEQGLHIGLPKGYIRMSSPTKKIIDEAKRLYEAGRSLTDLSKRFNFTPSAISRALRKAGTIMRKQGSGKQILATA